MEKYILVDGVKRVLTEEEFALEFPPMPQDELIADLKLERNRLLAETDWWAMSDRTMTQAEIDYRQALRDVPAQAGFPDNVTWPTKP